MRSSWCEASSAKACGQGGDLNRHRTPIHGQNTISGKQFSASVGDVAALRFPDMILLRLSPSGKLARVISLLCLLWIPFRCRCGGQEIRLQPALQQAVTKSMSGRVGTAVVLDVDSGRILAHYRLDFAARKLTHPGSALKPFTLLALLESGRLDPLSRVVCERKVRLGGRKMDCTHPQTGEALHASMALAYSCNYYFAHFASLLRKTDLREVLERAGLSSRTGLVEKEAAGMVRPTESLEQRQLQALGEANIEVTPLGLLAAYRKLALRRKQPEAQTPPLSIVFAGLEGSTTYGMGQLGQPLGLEVAGKTGTATSTAGRWTHAWFVGYAPAKNPDIVLLVFLERGRGGSDAAPVAREIFHAYREAKGSP